MFDPTDDLLSIYREGDASVMPGAPTGGLDGALPIEDYTAPDGHEPRMWYVREIIAAANPSNDTIDAGDRPSYWLVSVATQANVVVRFWPSAEPNGPALRVGSGGSARIPGVSQFISYEVSGAVATFNVIGVRGYPWAEVLYASS